MKGWELYLESDEVRNMLWAAKALLRDAWKADLKDPKSYPFNTSHALEQIKGKLLKRKTSEKRGESKEG